MNTTDDDLYETIRDAIEKSQKAAKAKLKKPTKPIVKYEQRVVGWIDILGFGQFVRETVDANNNPIQERVNRVARAITRLRANLASRAKSAPHRRSSLRIEQFSDSLLTSFVISPSDILETLIDFQLVVIDLAFEGFPSRGCIGYGHMAHTKNMFFGPAFIEVYEREQKSAVNPRIILDQSLLAFAFQHQKHVSEIFKGIIRKDVDEEWYIDYFGGAYEAIGEEEVMPAYYRALRSLIETGLMSSDRKTKKKYVWMRTKYNEMLRLFKHNIRNSAIHLDPGLETFYLKQPLIR